MADPARYLRIAAAARRLGVHEKTLRAWADKGLVAHLRLPSGHRRFAPEEIDRLRQAMHVEADGGTTLRGTGEHEE